VDSTRDDSGYGDPSRRSSLGLILAVDAGLSVNRAILFDGFGNLIAESKSELTIEQPMEGWAEQKPETIWNATRDNIRNILSKREGLSEEIIALGLTAHMHGTFLLDEEGRLARERAIVWIDTRTGDLINRFRRDGIEDEIFKISGWKLITSMQLLHLRWLKENEPETLRRTRCFVACKDYIRYRLTGEILSDFTDASFTGLFDNVKRRWSEDAFHLMGLDPSIAPEIREPWEVGGFITEEAARETGLKAGTPVTVGCGDVAAMALGGGATEDFQLLANIGAAGVYERPVESPLYDWENKNYTIASHAVPGKWLLQANQMSAALTLRWFRDNIFSGSIPFKRFDELAAKSKPGAGGVIFHPFLQGERSPFVNPNAKGLFFGLTLKTELKDLVRAILEGVAFAARDNLELLTRVRGERKFEVIMGGGAANSREWAQILSDVTGYTVKIPKVNEIGALGAAILGSQASRLYADHKEATEKMVKLEKRFEPNSETHMKYDEIFDIYRKLYRTLEPFYRP
jgi:xylulokinase